MVGLPASGLKLLSLATDKSFDRGWSPSREAKFFEKRVPRNERMWLFDVSES